MRIAPNVDEEFTVTGNFLDRADYSAKSDKRGR